MAGGGRSTGNHPSLSSGCRKGALQIPSPFQLSHCEPGSRTTSKAKPWCLEKLFVLPWCLQKLFCSGLGCKSTPHILTVLFPLHRGCCKQVKDGLTEPQQFLLHPGPRGSACREGAIFGHKHPSGCGEGEELPRIEPAPGGENPTSVWCLIRYLPGRKERYK